MKSWALVTVALYGLLLLLLTVPLALLGGLQWHAAEHVWRWQFSLKETLESMGTVWYWAWIGVLLTAQTLFLVVPVGVAERRPQARRNLKLPVLVASFLLGILLLAGVFAVLAGGFGDRMFDGFEIPWAWSAQVVARVPGLNAALGKIGVTMGSELVALLNVIGLFLFFWLLWGLIFYHYAKADEAETLVQRATRWLLRGSILELLVAVPSHILVRSRTECCAPFATFWGIVTGLSVMLLSFGPGVIFLFARRMSERRPKPRNL